MRVICVVALFAGLCSAAEEKPKDKAVKEELAKLQGAWYIAEVQFEGRTIAWMDLAEDAKIVIKGDRFETPPSRASFGPPLGVVGGNPKKLPAPRPVLKHICTESFPKIPDEAGFMVAIELDPAAKPKRLDVKGEEGAVQGVYALDGDVFTVCFAVPGKARPKEVKPENGVFLKLVREKAKNALDEARKKATQFDFCPF